MISFILVVRDRLEQARYSLPSVLCQAASCGGEVIVVDQDSGREAADYMAATCHESTVEANYVRLDRGGPFSRSWTLNVGARIASRPLLSFCDIDVVLDDKFSEAILRIHKEVFRGGPAVINCFPHQVDEGVSAKFKADKDLSLLQELEYSPWWTLGAGSHVDTESFKAVRGFDEAYDGWGCEDDDLFQRLRAYGCGWACAQPVAKCWHLWHPTVPRKDEHEPPNRKRLAESVNRIGRGDLSRNKNREWGSTDWVPV